MAEAEFEPSQHPVAPGITPLPRRALKNMPVILWRESVCSWRALVLSCLFHSGAHLPRSCDRREGRQGLGKRKLPQWGWEVRASPSLDSSKLYNPGFIFTVLNSTFLLIFREAFCVRHQRWASLVMLHGHHKYRPESRAKRSFNKSPALIEKVCPQQGLLPCPSIQLSVKSGIFGLTGWFYDPTVFVFVLI